MITFDLARKTPGDYLKEQNVDIWFPRETIMEAFRYELISKFFGSGQHLSLVKKSFILYNKAAIPTAEPFEYSTSDRRIIRL